MTKRCTYLTLYSSVVPICTTCFSIPSFCILPTNWIFIYYLQCHFEPNLGLMTRYLILFGFPSIRINLLPFYWLNSELILFIPHRHGPHRKHSFQQLHFCVTQLSHGPRREQLFSVSPLVHVRNMLPSNGRYLQSHYLATALRTTFYFIIHQSSASILSLTIAQALYAFSVE
jgi:hypothetical protein